MKYYTIQIASTASDEVIGENQTLSLRSQIIYLARHATPD
jgi:hypothetical protein